MSSWGSGGWKWQLSSAPWVRDPKCWGLARGKAPKGSYGDPPQLPSQFGIGLDGFVTGVAARPAPPSAPCLSFPSGVGDGGGEKPKSVPRDALGMLLAPSSRGHGGPQPPFCTRGSAVPFPLRLVPLSRGVQSLCQGHGGGSSGLDPLGAGTLSPTARWRPPCPGGHPRVLGGALLNPAMLGSCWAMELGVAAGGTALAVPWCPVFRGRAAPAVFARGVYCKSLSGCLRAITRRQVSALGTLPEGSWQLRERGAGDAQHRVAPHPRCSRSLWGILLGNPSPHPRGAGTARRQGVNVGVSWH